MSATARARAVRSMVVADMCPHRIRTPNPEPRIPNHESRITSPESRVQNPVNYRLGSHPQETCDVSSFTSRNHSSSIRSDDGRVARRGGLIVNRGRPDIDEPGTRSRPRYRRLELLLVRHRASEAGARDTDQ